MGSSGASTAGGLQTAAQLRDEFIGDLLAITGDTRRLWLPKSTDTATSTDETRNGATLTHGATLAGRLSALGLGYAATFNGSSDYASFPDAADLSFGNGTVDQAFTLLALANVTDTAAGRMLVSKRATGETEWSLHVAGSDVLSFSVFDDSAGVAASRGSDGAVTQGSPHLFGATYSAATGGATAGNDMTLWQDGLVIASTAANNGAYVAMEGKAAPVEIGSYDSHTALFMSGSMGLTLICAGALTAHQMWSVWRIVKAYHAL